MSRIVVTGGSGFIGTNLVDYLSKRGHDVLNFDIAPPRNAEHGHLWRPIDLKHATSLRQMLPHVDPDLIFHMAARTDLNGKTIRDYSANVDGVTNLIDAANELHHLRRVVFASSMLICKLGYNPRHESDYQPNTIYGESKALGEELVRNNTNIRFSWVIVRPTSIWGPWFGIPYRDFFDAIVKGVYFHPMGKTIWRSYGFVYNSVFQLDKIAFCDGALVSRRTFYLADYEPTELGRWATTIQRTVGASPIREVPVPLLKVGAFAGDLLKLCGVKSPPLTTFRLRNLLTNAVHDLEPLRAVCGSLPFDREAGVRITVDWLRRRH